MVKSLAAADGGLSVLQYPTSIRSAGMGQLSDPTSTPTSIYHSPNRRAEISAWQWIGGVGGFALTVNRLPVAISVNYFSIDGIEYRTNIPSELAQFNFGYSNAALGLTYGRRFGRIQAAASMQYLWERTLDYTANGIDFSISGDMDLTPVVGLTAGVRHAGFMSALDQESSKLPFAAFIQTAYRRQDFGLIGELSTGDFPVKVSGEYTFLELIHLYGGVQMSRNVDGAGTHFYPSAGFEIDWQTFTIGYSLYQLNHPVSPRQYLSLAWRF